METFYCLVPNDAYADYYISYYAKKMSLVVTDPLYIYYFGRGVTGNSKIPLEKFEKLCQDYQGMFFIKKFLENEGTYTEQKKFFSAWKQNIRNYCCGVCLRRVRPKNFNKAVKILYRYFNEKNDAHEIILHSLTMLRNHINWAANLEKTNKNLLAQMNYENKNARIKELQDWSKEQLKAKEWFLSQIKYKDERIADLEKYSGFCYKILSKIFRILRGKN